MHSFLEELGLSSTNSGVCGRNWVEAPGGGTLVSINPSTGEAIASVTQGSADDYDRIAHDADAAFERWRDTPAPKRGQIVRQLADALRAKKSVLAELITLEAGKTRTDANGEIQQVIDICDYAVGLSRQLCGSMMHSERPGHRLYEQWHPLGPIGVITSFNSPTGVWLWNAVLALVCGDTVAWKPSSETPLCAIAAQRILHDVLVRNDCGGLLTLCVGNGSTVGDAMARDPRMKLISVTGSCGVGARIAQHVAARFGRTILELGGNNATIVLDDADMKIAAKAIAFSALVTAGQRCTGTRRLIVQRGIAPALIDKLVHIYQHVRVGDPRNDDTLVGPLINARAVDEMLRAVERARSEGATVLCGGRKLDRPGFFVEPTLIRATPDMPIVDEETFAPVLYVMECDNIDDAIAINNRVTQGLSSALITRDLRAEEAFLGARGSDCGIANVNVGTAGSEIGVAFGGEKSTGGGRELGSDAWKQYMRRQAVTINWSNDLPLSQGVHFDV